MIGDDERVLGGDGDGTAGEAAAGEAAAERADEPPNVGSGVVSVNGRQVAYRRAGSAGPPVVLLHGAGVDDGALSWSTVLPELGRDHRVYAPDWPGHGDSEDAPEHSIAAYHDVLEGFLDALALDVASLAGISMGGGVALSFALENPERVRRLALLSSYGLGGSLPAGSLWYALANVPGANQAGYAAMGASRMAARNGLAQVVHDASALDDAFVEAFRERASRRGAGAAFAAFQRNEIGPAGRVESNFAPRLPELDVPTLFVHGADDPLFPVTLARRAAERAPDARLVELADCGHWPTQEHPERVTAELAAFLDAGD